MGSSVTNWVKKNVLSRYLMTNCPEQKKCLELVTLILDGESTPEQEREYFNHIDQCWNCFQDYELEKAIRELVKSKIERKQVPLGLIDEIKVKIEQSA